MLEVGTGFHPELTGRENIYMNGAILGMTKAEIDSKIDDIIEFSECGQFIDTPVKRYSSGMYVKLAFSVAAHLDSEIMIMDEVLAVGDAKFQQKCLGKMGDAANLEGKTVLYVSHNMETIRQLCTRCIVLKKGQIIFDGDVETAISYYLDSRDFDLKTNYDLSQFKRYEVQFGTIFKLMSFSFIDCKSPIYSQQNKMKFRIAYVAKEKLERLHLICWISTWGNDSVGIAQSDYFDVLETEEEKTVDFSFDISNLYDGKYLFNIEVHSVNDFNTRIKYDYGARFPFEVRGNNKDDITYDAKYRKYVRLNRIEMI